MEERKARRSHFATTLVCFILTTITAIILLVTALVVWLSYITGSLIIAALLIGVFFAIISWLIYLLAIRDPLDRLHEQIETIYEVAHTMQIGYKWIIDMLAIFKSFIPK